MNDIATQSDRAATIFDPNSTYNPFGSAAKDLGTRGTLIFFKKGEFLSGEDEITLGTRFAADIMNARHGWVCWVKEEMVEKIMLPIIEQRLPKESELTDHGPYETKEDGTKDGWSKSLSIDLVGINSGAECTFELSSATGLSSVGRTLQEFGRQFRLHPDETPIVEFQRDFYMHKDKKIGKVYFPVLKIVGWIKNVDVEAKRNGVASSTGADDPSAYADGANAGGGSESIPTGTPTIEGPAADTPQENPAPTGRSARTF